MASMLTKRRHSGTKEDPAVAKKHSSNEPNTDNVVPVREIFLPYSDDEVEQVVFSVQVKKDVDFNARLKLVKAASEEEQDQYVFQDVDPKGLAYSAGFRDGDILREVNGDNIEGSGINHVLGLLRNYEEVEIFLGVKRDRKLQPYIWVIFEIVEKDGVPVVHVNHTAENDTDELPLIFLSASKPCFVFDRKSVQYDIYFRKEGKHFYLAIEKGNAVFQKSYNPLTCSFHKYYYAGNPPSKGQVVVYSLENLEPYEPKSKPKLSPTPTPKTTPASGDNLELMDMPHHMVEWERPIHITNPRFWFEKKLPGPPGEEEAFLEQPGVKGGAYSVSLQSVNADPQVGADSRKQLKCNKLDGASSVSLQSVKAETYLSSGKLTRSGYTAVLTTSTKHLTVAPSHN